ncbi:MAG: hypothetical protein P0Y58_02175 [Candidatus Pseudomonas phytovorans]|uniref:Uncharacterized protein n=1 Tax=Candidatus Pseudomonas phytovorans TaxID=3121377 RepID=A0AAJ5WFT9_9PSED|nr:hypothetical protein [Pseudomonas sp.]WEK31016.1 MAG: hypothetical protein P0Y58_02175 [Pseudomonas sp.]
MSNFLLVNFSTPYLQKTAFKSAKMNQNRRIERCRMVGFIEQDLGERLRASEAVPYVRRIAGGYFVLEISTPDGVHILQRQRGGDRVFKTFETLLGLLAKQGVIEFAIVLDEAKVIPGGPPPPWLARPQHDQTSHASWRHDFDIPF